MEMFQGLVVRDWSSPLAGTLTTLFQILALVVVILVALAFLLLFDRKVWGAVQMRKGPNVVGPFGLLQSFADFFKFVLKEVVIPDGADKTVFLIAPLITFILATIAWAVIPVGSGLVVSNINVGILYLFAVSSLGVYGIIMGGWASNSKYPFLGSLRSAAQMVSYEVSVGLVIVCVLLLAGTLNLQGIVLSQAVGLGTMIGLPPSLLDWHIWPLFPMFIVFIISSLAETNRPPFDLPEAESELVAGYMVEYSSTPYLLFMLGEYLAMILLASLTVVLFMGGWLPIISWGPFLWIPGVVWFLLKVFLVFFLYSLVKAFVPRYRYDQLMRLGWKVFLPLTLAFLVVEAFVVKAFQLGFASV